MDEQCLCNEERWLPWRGELTSARTNCFFQSKQHFNTREIRTQLEEKLGGLSWVFPTHGSRPPALAWVQLPDLGSPDTLRCQRRAIGRRQSQQESTLRLSGTPLVPAGLGMVQRCWSSLSTSLRSSPTRSWHGDLPQDETFSLALAGMLPHILTGGLRASHPVSTWTTHTGMVVWGQTDLKWGPIFYWRLAPPTHQHTLHYMKSLPTRRYRHS